jgi:DNA-binding MarR family transcriptional regulator
MPDHDPAADARTAENSSEFLCFAIYAASHAFTRVYKPLLDAVGLTYPQYLVMVQLWKKDDQTVGNLGDRLFLESSTLTPLLKRLEALGVLRRSRDPDDERQVRIRLTDHGRSLRHRAADIPRCIAAASGLTSGDARRLLDEMTALRKSLESHALSGQHNQSAHQAGNQPSGR